MPPIEVSLKLEVVAGNKIVVPGREPLSDVTSTALLSRMTTVPAMVDVKKALEAIPGSKLEYPLNWSGGGSTSTYRRAYFVLPPHRMGCPCSDYQDWYKVLGDLAEDVIPLEEKYESCEVFGQGFCPSPAFNEEPTPEPDPYLPEGGSPYGYAGVLPPTPPWNR